MFTVAFGRDLAERSISTFAQAFGAAVLADAGGVVGQAGVEHVNWTACLSVALLATLLAALKGLAAYKFGDETTGASALSEPPPLVEPEVVADNNELGQVNVVVVLLVAILVVALLVLFGFGADFNLRGD